MTNFFEGPFNTDVGILRPTSIEIKKVCNCMLLNNNISNNNIIIIAISFILTISGIVLPQQQKIMLTLHITMPSLAYT